MGGHQHDALAKVNDDGHHDPYSQHHDHPDQTHRDEDNHTKSVWYGMAALSGIVGLLFFERVVTIVNDLCIAKPIAVGTNGEEKQVSEQVTGSK